MKHFRPRADILRWLDFARVVQAFAATMIVVAAGALRAQPVEQQLIVVEQVWGFDGRVQPGQFNPLSILLDNQTDTPIDATATLQRIQGLLTPTGGKYTQQIFIAPAARRWIQFYPYIANSHQSEWRLKLGEKKIQDFTQPRSAAKEYNDKEAPAPQIIILDKANRISTQPSAVKHLPENIFPPYSTATFGLHTVFLDHVPDWEAPRQQAFMSWLKLGGRLHILKNSRDEYPSFSADLAELSQPLDRFTIGNGLVVRHSTQRNSVTEQMVKRATVIDTQADVDTDLERLIEEQGRTYGNQQLSETDASMIDDTFFRTMRELTLPEHAWWLIFLLAIAYIGLIFPGCFILSKQKELHFLTTYGAIIGLSLVFSGVFLLIGRRGYGETTTLQTLAVAQSEDSTHWNVLQWNALFVTSGDNYTAGEDDQQSVYSTADTMESNNASLVAGNKGIMTMRIPPYSSQTFISRRQIADKDWGIRFVDYQTNATGLSKLTLETNDNFPAAKDATYMALWRRRLHRLTYTAATQQLKLHSQLSNIGRYCQQSGYYSGFAPTNSLQRKIDERTDEEKFFDESLPTLVRRSLLDDLSTNPGRFELPADRIRLLVYTDIPESIKLSVSAETKRTGRILFIKDLDPSAQRSGEINSSGPAEK